MRELEARVGHDRFRQHFAVHETEAWLLSDPSLFPRAITSRLPARGDRPESVNFAEPPSRLLQRFYHAKGREYKEVTDGADLFGRLSPRRPTTDALFARAAAK